MKKLVDNKVSLSKFSPPMSEHWLQRKRLFSRFDAFSESTSIWISGQAGYGKTVLAASYLRSKGISVLWLRLDKRDMEPSTFFYNLRDAAIQLGFVEENELPLLTAEYTGGEDVYARNFVEMLFNKASKGLVLVFDDFQYITAVVCVRYKSQSPMCQRQWILLIGLYLRIND